MEIVNIVVEVSDGHIASIYALVLSIITNKYEESIYHIYLENRHEAILQLEPLLSLQSDTVKIFLSSEEKVDAFSEDAICLQWNMIVTGDLTEISELEPKEFGDETSYDILSRRDFHILRSDSAYSPEEYFDHPLSGYWLKCYKESPIKDVPLRRRSYIETLGYISVESFESAVPVAISTCDCDIPGTIALLNSIRNNTLSSTQLDIRIFYRNLSQKHVNELLSLRDDNTSIILYNVKRCTDADNPITKVIPVLLAFDEYETVIYMDSKCLCLGDIVSLYRNAVKPYVVRVVGDILDTGEMPKVMLLNSGPWIQNDICGRYIALSSVYRCFQELMSIASGKRVGSVKAFPILSFHDKDNPWMCPDKTIARLVWKYLSISPHYDQLKTEALSYDQQRGVANMQELLKRLKDLEIENNRLSQQVQRLEEDNTSLRSERDQFLYELLETRKSFTYRIGRAITFLPRKMRGEQKTGE